MTHPQDKLLRRLDELLDIERAALLGGDLRALSEIVDEKEDLIEKLNQLEFAEPNTFEDVGEKMQYNQQLLEQALNGIRNVAQRLAELRRVRREFDTYTESGKKSRIETDAESSVEKRA